MSKPVFESISGNFTPLQNHFFDFIAPTLKEGELKVMLFIFRRTQGFNKTRDYITMSQFTDGIRDREGNVLSLGTGLKKKAVLQALKSLDEKGLIIQLVTGQSGFQKRIVFLNTESNQEIAQKLAYAIRKIPVSQGAPPPYPKDTPPVSERYPQKKSRQKQHTKESLDIPYSPQGDGSLFDLPLLSIRDCTSAVCIDETEDTKETIIDYSTDSEPEQPINQSETESALKTTNSAAARPASVKNTIAKDSLFHRFWETQLKKVEKKRAIRAWIRSGLEKDKAKAKQVCEAWENQLEVYKTKDLRFIKHPSTWLNGECWNDIVHDFDSKITNLKPHKSQSMEAKKAILDSWKERIQRGAV